ncbi:MULTISPECIES: hypothetical protein [Curtobacterium]|uniref:Uncharacterized protein n=1 Tax=Curtobacterium oceanosedimentum TaxID=465820 RepID=A0ABR5S7P6_9MICO|nr:MULTISPECIES: hypothetical protein [Curtobacterium]KTR41073.1 hypothetical protein NS263_05925 [Curtobacterium oceanosedimentum]UBQ02575.1 hypothetical protein LCG91_16255 [Curtobacterium sp. TXMA1]
MTRLAAPFLMAVPPGWTRFPARPEDRDHLDTVIEAVVRDAVPDDLPRDRAAPFRDRARQQLRSTVSQAGENGAIAVYLPTRSVDGFMPPVSLIESEVDDESEDTPEVVVGRLLADAGQLGRGVSDDPASQGVREVDGALAARIEETHRRVRVLEGLPDLDDRQVTYTIDAPHRPGVWVVLSYSVVSDPEADQRVVDALVQLFDTLVGTLRWVDVPGREPGALDRRLEEIAEARS